jgi:hypothetical protein
MTDEMYREVDESILLDEGEVVRLVEHPGRRDEAETEQELSRGSRRCWWGRGSG